MEDDQVTLMIFTGVRPGSRATQRSTLSGDEFEDERMQDRAAATGPGGLLTGDQHKRSKATAGLGARVTSRWKLAEPRALALRETLAVRQRFE